MTDTHRVNYIRHLNTFFSLVRKDNRLKANDISLYLALFHLWNQHQFRKTLCIHREEVMQLSKIGSRSTYVSCLKNLQEYGYIHYHPADRPYAPSQVSIIPFSDTEQLSLFKDEKNGPQAIAKSGPGTRHKTGPHTGPGTDPHTGPKTGRFINKQLNNEKESQKTPTKKSLPTLEETTTWFIQKGHPAAEARKFFFHNQAIGWSLSGHPITNWPAAAEKWMENIKHTTDVKQGQLHTNRNKSYNTPL